MKFSCYCRSLLFATVASLILAAFWSYSQSSNLNPVLAVSPDSSGSNRLNVSIANPIPRHLYRIEKRNALNDATGWQFHVQTMSNFSIVPEAVPSQFFRAVLFTQALPEIVSFTVSPATLAASGSANLRWLVNDATGLRIDNGIGDVTGTTSRVAIVTATRIYSLTATNSIGSAKAIATVVLGQLPSQSSGRAVNDHVIVEHNIVRDSSWAVRDVACEFRYNLILGAGHEWMWITGDNAFVHHNIFAGGDADVTGIWLIYGPQNVRFWNNTIDGFNQVNGPNVLLVGTDATADVQSCAFFNTRVSPTVAIDGALTNAGYNSFYNPQVSGNHNYSDNRHPATDIGGLNAQIKPGLTNAVNSYGIDDTAMWLRTTSLRQVLQTYRTRYTPAAGSPLIDAGHGGNGNDIGAIGTGAPNSADQFGILNP